FAPRRRVLRLSHPSGGRFAGSEGGKISVRIGQVTADRDRILGGQHARAMCLEQGLRCARRFGRGIEGPAEMLARMASTAGAAVMRKHLLVEPVDDDELRG